MLTIGHGTLDADAFAALVTGAGIGRIADVRAFPGSRRHPHFGRDVMASWLADAGVDYRWLPALGGRRRSVPDSAHVALRNTSFRSYADHMSSEEFSAGVEALLALAAGAGDAGGPAGEVAYLCSESVWWRCHRRLLSDHLVLVRGVEVVHLMHDGRRTPHAPTDGVRVEGDGLVYDAGAPPTLFP